jgi:hypothetical protein
MRIKRLHCGIKPGKSWVLLAHRKCIADYSKGANAWIDEFGEAHTDIIYQPGIFGMFLVDQVEYVIPENDYQDAAERENFAAAGIVLVKVLHDENMGDQDEYPETDQTGETVKTGIDIRDRPNGSYTDILR